MVKTYAIMECNRWQQSIWFRLADEEYIKNQLKLLENIDETSGRIIDIGCGDGSFTHLVAKKTRATEICGIEIITQVAKKAKEKGVEVVVADANKKFPFKDSSFHLLIANQIIEHLNLPNLDNFFREVYRILKNDGHAIISTPSIASPHNLLLLLRGARLHRYKSALILEQTGGHKKFTIKTLKNMSSCQGFEIEKVFGSGFYPSFLSKWLPSCNIYIGIKIRKVF